MAQTKIGWRPYVSGTDADAQAFITAAAITDSTQQSAINTLVTQLKTYGIWTKMKALYPFVGGTAAQHRYNLKAPTTNASDFYLIPYGGITHSSNGVQFNGTTGYFDTQLTPLLILTQNSSHLSFYSRTNTSSDSDAGGQDDQSPNGQFYSLANNSNAYFSIKNADAGRVVVANTNSQGMFLASRTAASLLKGYKNDVLKGSNTTTSGTGGMNIPSLLGGFNYRNSYGTITKYYSGKEFAFASIGDGLTDTEVTNFYTAVQTYQSTLGRNVGTPIVADADAQAFLNAAAITDLGQANAVNVLVTDLKSANIWTKMKALYPMVGGSATSHKFNLKDPRDLDAAFRLVFNGGWTHTSTGALPNGTTGYADTKLVPSTNYPTVSDVSIGFYSRTNIAQTSSDIAAYQNSSKCIGFQTRWTDNNIYSQLYRDASPYNIVATNTDSSGLFTLSRTSTSSLKQYRNSTILGTSTASIEGSIPTIPICLSNNGANGSYSSREQAFAFIGNGLSDAEATAFYTSVQKFQTSLGRQV